MIHRWSVIVLAGVCAVAGCAQQGPASGSPGAASGGTAARYSQVTGVLESLPDKERTGIVFVRLDAVPRFVGPSGQVQPLSQVMLPFRVAGDAMTGFQVGDPVTFDFEVDWEEATPGRIVRVARRETPPSDSPGPDPSRPASPSPRASDVPTDRAAVRGQATAARGTSAAEPRVPTGEPRAASSPPPATTSAPPRPAPAAPSAQAPAAPRVTGIPVADRLRQLVATQFGLDLNEVTLAAKFIDDLGGDDLDAVELVLAIEEEFDVEIPADRAKTLETVGDVLAFLQESGVKM